MTPEVELVPWAAVVPRDGDLDGLPAFDRPAVCPLLKEQDSPFRVNDPDRIARMVREVRADAAYTPKPILFNEDDHFDFGRPVNHFTAAVSEYASWGYFDYRMKGEGFDEGYQSVPVNWKTSSARKRGFFKLLSEMTGEKP